MYFFDDIPQLLEIVKKNVSVVHILVDESDYNSKLNISMVKLNTIDIKYTVKKVREVVTFFKDYHEYQGDAEDMYKLLLKMEKGNHKVIDLLLNDLFYYIEDAFKTILNKEEVYLSDILDLYGFTPIYKKDYKEDVKILNRHK